VVTFVRSFCRGVTVFYISTDLFAAVSVKPFVLYSQGWENTLQIIFYARKPANISINITGFISIENGENQSFNWIFHYIPSIVTAETNAINKLTRMQHRLQLLTQNFGEIKRYRICIKEYQSQRTLIIIFYLLNVFDPKATVLM